MFGEPGVDPKMTRSICTPHLTEGTKSGLPWILAKVALAKPSSSL